MYATFIESLEPVQYNSSVSRHHDHCQDDQEAQECLPSVFCEEIMNTGGNLATDTVYMLPFWISQNQYNVLWEFPGKFDPWQSGWVSETMT